MTTGHSLDSLSQQWEAFRTLPEPDFYMPLKDDIGIRIGQGKSMFTRASEATYVRNGVLHKAAVDEPRFEDEGILIEGSSTNLCPYPITEGSTTYYYWNTSYTNVSVEAGVSPFGDTRDINKVTSVSSSGMYVRIRKGSGPKPRGYATSLFLKGDVGTLVVRGVGDGYTPNMAYIQPDNSYTTKGSITVQVYSLSNGWRRVCAYDAEATEALAFEVDTGSTFYLYGAQIEELPFASSYIPTNGAAVTRAADKLSVPSIPPMSYEATVSMSVQSFGFIGNNRLYDFRNGAEYAWVLYNGSYLSGKFKDVENTSVVGPDYLGTSKRISYSPKSGLFSDGVLLAKSNLTDTGFTGYTSAFLGDDTGTGSRSIWGHIKDFRIWNTALTQEQVQLIGGTHA